FEQEAATFDTALHHFDDLRHLKRGECGEESSSAQEPVDGKTCSSEPAAGEHIRDAAGADRKEGPGRAAATRGHSRIARAASGSGGARPGSGRRSSHDRRSARSSVWTWQSERAPGDLADVREAGGGKASAARAAEATSGRPR